MVDTLDSKSSGSNTVRVRVSPMAPLNPNMLYFVTGNQNKFLEASKIIPELIQTEIDLIEIQSLNTLEIIQAKLLQAHHLHPDKNLIVEDISVEISALNGFPGPLIKWFLQSLGEEEIWQILKNKKDKSAKVICNLGHIDNNGKIKYFEASLEGEIVSVRGDNGFGFDPIFKPKGSTMTLAEMGIEAKNQISYRARVFNQLKSYLTQQ
jgi:non-canonical purine NTP pyrophosphatase (RdgB/HAM1 family)